MKGGDQYAFLQEEMSSFVFLYRDIFLLSNHLRQDTCREKAVRTTTLNNKLQPTFLIPRCLASDFDAHKLDRIQTRLHISTSKNVRNNNNQYRQAKCENVSTPDGLPFAPEVFFHSDPQKVKQDLPGRQEKRQSVNN